MTVYSAVRVFDQPERIYTFEPYKNLIAAIILQAVKDATGKDPFTAAEAAAWLYSEGVAYAEALGVDPEKYTGWLDRMQSQTNEN